jgi:hypothetical protein
MTHASNASPMISTTRQALAALVAVAGSVAIAAAQTFTITPSGGGLANPGPVFRHTPIAGVAAPTFAGLTSATAAHSTYSFSQTGIGQNDAYWRGGWFFRVAGDSREFAFINAASSTSGTLIINRTGGANNNLGTSALATIDYSVNRGATWSFTSSQSWLISNPAQGPLVLVRNAITNTGDNPLTINLFWVADLDVPTLSGDDIIIARPGNTGLEMRNLSGALPILFMPRGNANAYIGRGGVGFPFGTTALDDMVDAISTNFNNTVPPANAGFDRTYGYQWTVTIPPAGGFLAETGIQIIPLPPCGLSDIAGPNQTIGFDGVLTADDIIVFLSWYFGSVPAADVAGANQSTTPDGQFTADDIIVFLSRYFAGCN